MAGTVVADTLQADSTSTLVIKNGVANTPPTIQDSSGTQIGTFCRAWVNFNGTLVTNPASMTGVRASFNVSSILDNGTGDYTISFTTAMPDVNYAVSGAVGLYSVANTASQILKIRGGNSADVAASSVRLATVQVTAGTATNLDYDYVAVSIFR